ncbi:Terminase small subunit [Gemmata obscuriglobus]|uniref:Terminase small subunit n=2 Tax=Gemmata TaxID=113 RepID=A0A2Z3H617_9BACT|nr:MULTISPECIES: terminase small subunit [Gemmata]AWM40341.1 terminase small subunit [Gemmata obscuriglobus]MDY3558253.1 terminase small subunit [Gemmata algarum]QEG26443.1 Terminase small subunit [Gemmata obscuriglobus]VTS01617.1 terminase small subunit : Terminase small subunit OS=Burkholderia pseudomallei MSHR7498 GN=X963_695 PE=4 SV=1: Terminase_2 [Gemmata obscuriglobus UQM 2246]
MKLTPRQQRFVQEYLVDRSPSGAAVRAGYSTHSARKIGEQNLKKPPIAAAIAAATGCAKPPERPALTPDAVLQRLWLIATADPNEIIEHRRTCCRYCHGDGHRYHWTQSELDAARAAHAEGKKADEPFDPLGGPGYDPRRPPAPKCPECFGDGVGAVYVKDTRRLSPGARALWAGVKQTKDGVEARLNDQQAALVTVARHLGMFTDAGAAKDTDLPDLSGITADELDRLLAALRPLFAPPPVGGGGTGGRP